MVTRVFSINNVLQSRYSAEGSSFRLRVNAYGKKLTCDDITNRIDVSPFLRLEDRDHLLFQPSVCSDVASSTSGNKSRPE